MEMLDPNDYVGVSFWIISVAMVAAVGCYAYLMRNPEQEATRAPEQ